MYVYIQGSNSYLTENVVCVVVRIADADEHWFIVF